MGRWSRELAGLLVRFAGVRDGDNVLDVGSGTGSIAAAVAAIAPSSHIVGLDPAAAYVAFAQARHGDQRTRFAVGDGQRDPVPRRRVRSHAVAARHQFRSRSAEGRRGDDARHSTRRDVAAAVMGLRRRDGDAATRSGTRSSPFVRMTRRRTSATCGCAASGELATLWRSHDLQDVTEDALTVRPPSRHSTTTGPVSGEARARGTLRRGAAGADRDDAAARHCDIG